MRPREKHSSRRIRDLEEEGAFAPPAPSAWYRAPMRGLALGALALFLPACGPRREAPPAPRLLVVGWDGASYRAIDPLLRAGRLPHLAALIERGTRAELESTIVPISSAAWTAATTGKGPGRTGVFAFHAPVAGSYALELVSARSNRAAPLWR